MSTPGPARARETDSAEGWSGGDGGWKPESPRAHDELSFEELSRRYNFRLTSNNRVTMARLVIDECRGRTPPVRALDIGCGRGIGRQVRYTRAIAGAADELWGIEPDTGITPEEGLFDRFQHATAESAELPENYFDTAYSYMVMEHVEDPAGFLRAVHRCLKPGGTYLFITPNARHYFTMWASALERVNFADGVLRVLKGKKAVEGYHYPVRYVCNSPAQIDGLAAEIGFAAPEYAFVEPDGPRGYLPGPLKVIFHALAWKRKVIRKPEVLLTLICRLTKPA